jgi:hypothetical protein
MSIDVGALELLEDPADHHPLECGTPLARAGISANDSNGFFPYVPVRSKGRGGPR